MSRILIVEDEKKLARFLELELSHEGYDVSKSENGTEASSLIDAALLGEGEEYDLILLDIMLPGINGMEVLRRMRVSGEAKGVKLPPVIILTARDQVMDKVAGLDAGAVDYITKPFAIEELLARIRVALKLYRTSQDNGKSAAETMPKAEPSEGELKWGELTLNTLKHRVYYRGTEILLTNREFTMLKILLENQDIVLSRDVLLSKVCGYDYAGETNVIDVYVRYLRHKIDETFDIKMIQTVRGVGYVIYSGGPQGLRGDRLYG